MTNWLWCLICIFAGLILGIIYLIWLWRKVQMLISHTNPHAWLLHGIARFGLLIICFFLLSGHNWQNWIACLIGWTSLRILVLFQVLRQLSSTARGTA